MSAIDLYTSGEYAHKNHGWHLYGAEEKARHLLPLFDSLPKLSTVADIGTGAGGVPAELSKRLGQGSPRFIGYEVAEDAARIARERFPDLEIRQRLFRAVDGPFDATMFVDVLEHLENPWEMLRAAREASKFLIVHQPLLANFGLFRRNKYRVQRETWGHIAFFNWRSFHDMAMAAGWSPLSVDLLPPWKIANNPVCVGRTLRPLKRLVFGFAPLTASFLLEGFYLNGVFK